MIALYEEQIENRIIKKNKKKSLRWRFLELFGKPVA